VEDENDSFMQLAEASIRSGAEANDYLILDFVPWLKYLPKWFPGAKVHKIAEAAMPTCRSFRYDAFEVAKRKLSEGSAKECMATILLDENTNEDGTIKDEQTFSDAAATAYIGGVVHFGCDSS